MEKSQKISKLKQILTGITISAAALASAGCYTSYRSPPRVVNHTVYTSTPDRVYIPHNSGFGYYPRHPGVRVIGGYSGYSHSGSVKHEVPHRSYTHPVIVPPRGIRKPAHHKQTRVQRLRQDRREANQVLQRETRDSRNNNSSPRNNNRTSPRQRISR